MGRRPAEADASGLRRAAPRLGAIAALAALAAQGAYTVVRLVPGARRPTVSARAAATPDSRRGAVTLDRRIGDLFGAATGEQATAAAPVGYRLLGVIALIDPRRGWAIVGTAPGVAGLYAVGARFPDGAQLAEVWPDRIVLATAAGRATVAIPRQFGAAELAALVGGGSGPAAAATVDQDASRQPGDPVVIAATNPHFDFDIVPGPDGLQGVRVRSNGDPLSFSRLHLQAGDVVMSVDGIGPDRPRAFERVLGTLGSGRGPVAVAIRRGDSPIMLSVLPLESAPPAAAAEVTSVADAPTAIPSGGP